MADHGKVEYATAAGNDLPAHESTYESFVHFSLVGSIAVICIVLGLGISTLTPHWIIGTLVTFLISPIILVHGLLTGSRLSAFIGFGISLLLFAMTTLSSGGAGH